MNDTKPPSEDGGFDVQCEISAHGRCEILGYAQCEIWPTGHVIYTVLRTGYLPKANMKTLRRGDTL